VEEEKDTAGRDGGGGGRKEEPRRRSKGERARGAKSRAGYIWPLRSRRHFQLILALFHFHLGGWLQREEGMTLSDGGRRGSWYRINIGCASIAGC
jgi:hypothetical protein